MASEIQASAKLTLRKGNNAVTLESLPPVVADQTGVGDVSVAQEIGTSEEDIDLTTLTNKGWAMIRNLDATNYVNWGPKSGGAMVAVGRLYPGGFAMLQLHPSVTLRMVASTAPCLVKVSVFEA